MGADQSPFLPLEPSPGAPGAPRPEAWAAQLLCPCKVSGAGTGDTEGGIGPQLGEALEVGDGTQVLCGGTVGADL